MGLSHVDDDRNQKRESVALVSLEDVEEIIIFEETHRSVSHLQVKSRNAFDQSFEHLWNVWLKFLNLTSLKNLNKFTDEHDLLGRVSKRPVLDQSVKQEKTQRGIFCKEEHRTSHEVLMEEVTGLNLVKRNDHILEENDVFFSQGNCKSRDDAGQDIKKFRSSIELESLVNETCLLYTSPSPRDQRGSRMPSSA